MACHFIDLSARYMLILFTLTGNEQHSAEAGEFTVHRHNNIASSAMLLLYMTICHKTKMAVFKGQSKNMSVIVLICTGHFR